MLCKWQLILCTTSWLSFWCQCHNRSYAFATMRSWCLYSVNGTLISRQGIQVPAALCGVWQVMSVFFFYYYCVFLFLFATSRIQMVRTVASLRPAAGTRAWRTNLLLFHAGSSESEQKPETSQAESAQGLESAQEDVVAPQPPMTAASTKGRGSGRGQGRGKGQSGVRATACKAAATADDAQGTQHIGCMLTE